MSGRGRRAARPKTSPVDVAVRDVELLEADERDTPAGLDLEKWGIPVRFDDESCCVREWTATSAPKRTREYQGQTLMVPMRQRLDFRIRMGAPADAARVRVIQYVRATVRDENGHDVPLPRHPGDTPWKWAPGPDGFVVDSRDRVRCWPELGPDTPYGLERDETTGVVTWYDNPGLSARRLNDALASADVDADDLPWTFTGEFKTDVLCTDEDVCRPESPSLRELLPRVIPACVVATAFWSLAWRVHAAPADQGMVGVMLANEFDLVPAPPTRHRPCRREEGF